MSLRIYFLGTMIVCIIPLIAVIAWITLSAAKDTQKCAISPDQGSFNVASIYWVPWSTMTVFRYTVDDVIELANQVKLIESPSDLECLASTLAKPQMSPSESRPEQLNGRLVVNVETSEGELLTYFADRFEVCIVEKKLCGKNDESFRSDISEFMEKTTT